MTDRTTNGRNAQRVLCGQGEWTVVIAMVNITYSVGALRFTFV
jgi:hypothetical protein